MYMVDRLRLLLLLLRGAIPMDARPGLRQAASAEPTRNARAAAVSSAPRSQLLSAAQRQRFSCLSSHIGKGPEPFFPTKALPVSVTGRAGAYLGEAVAIGVLSMLIAYRARSRCGKIQRISDRISQRNLERTYACVPGWPLRPRPLPP